MTGKSSYDRVKIVRERVIPLINDRLRGPPDQQIGFQIDLWSLLEGAGFDRSLAVLSRYLNGEGPIMYLFDDPVLMNVTMIYLRMWADSAYRQPCEDALITLLTEAEVEGWNSRGEETEWEIEDWLNSQEEVLGEMSRHLRKSRKLQEYGRRLRRYVFETLRDRAS